MSRPARHTEFHYGPDRQRTLKRELSGLTVTSRTHYVGSVEVVLDGTNPGTTAGEYRRQIAGVAIATWYEATGASQTHYLHTDHLGSTTAITDESGAVVTWMSYDAFGQRRNADGWHPWSQPPAVYLNAMLSITPRGYTGHEHVDHAGIIHMNGRIYDPSLGRFLQADPFIEDTTTLNRYTYVHNNPLAYTDPSGYLSVKDVVKIAVVVVVSVATAGAATAAITAKNWGAAAGWVALGGAVAGGVMTGTWEGAMWGAFTAVAFMGVGQWAGAWGEWSQGTLVGNMSARGLAAKSVTQGLVGGTLNRLQGGHFGHGFASAGVTAAASPSISDGFGGNRYLQGATAALVGGTTSRITGGKFANGAVTAAMAYAFNQLASSASRTLTEEEQRQQALIDRELARYEKAVLQSDNTDWKENMLATDVTFDPDFIPPEGSSPNTVAIGCHACGPGQRNQITIGPGALDLLNPDLGPFPYHGTYFYPGEDGLLDLISHEFGHTFESNLRLYQRAGASMAEQHANQHMRQVRRYYP